jgi:WD40 repeat protein
MTKRCFLMLLFFAFVSSATAQQNTYQIFSTPDFTLDTGSPVSDVAYSPEGRVLASASGQTVTLWDTATGQILHSASTEGDVLRLKFIADGSMLVASVAPDQLYIWNTSLEESLGIIRNGLPLVDFDIAPDSDTVAQISETPTGNLISLFSLDDTLNGGVEMRDLALDVGVGQQLKSVAFDPTGRYLAAGVWYEIIFGAPIERPNESLIYVWDIVQNSPPRRYHANITAPITQVQFSPDGTSLFAASYNLMAWEVAQDEIAFLVQDGNYDTGLAVGGSFVASAQPVLFRQDEIDNARTPVILRRWQTGETLAIFRRAAAPAEPFGGEGPPLSRVPIALKRNGTQMATVDPGGVISLWNLGILLDTPQPATANVVAYCDALGETPAPIAANQPVTIIWSWFATTIPLVEDHRRAADYTITLDGEPIPNSRLSPIQRDPANDNHWTLYYRAPVGLLEPGAHTVTYHLTWQVPITDGLDEFGPGTAQEDNTGQCQFTVT